MAKNIQINYNNGNGYEILHPENVLANITDWASSIYSKSEVDSLVKNAGKFKFEQGTRRGTGTCPQTTGTTIYSIAMSIQPFLFGLIESESGFGWPTYGLRDKNKIDGNIWQSDGGFFFFCKIGTGEMGSNTRTVGFNEGWAVTVDIYTKTNGLDVKFGYLWKGNGSAPSELSLSEAVFNAKNQSITWWALGVTS